MARQIEITIKIKDPAERVRTGLFYIQALVYFLTIQPDTSMVDGIDNDTYAIHLGEMRNLIDALVSECVGGIENETGAANE